MAQHINQVIKPQINAMNMMGQPIPFAARQAGYEHCKEMGLNSARSIECVDAVAEQLSRDKPFEAQAAGMRFLDLTGTYRLFAVLLTETAILAAAPTPTGSRGGEIVSAIKIFQDRAIAAAEAAHEEMFLGIPDAWYEPSPVWGCDNGHVSRRYLKSEERGCLCLECHKNVAIIPQGYTDESLTLALAAIRANATPQGQEVALEDEKGDI